MRVHPSIITFSGDRRFISSYIVVKFIDILSQTFLFIRPTTANLAAYERWSGSEIQSHTWLGDMVDEVTKVDLIEGNTMIIPTGWIHAVVRCPLNPFLRSLLIPVQYTPQDALVFGGNFLHSYNAALRMCASSRLLPDTHSRQNLGCMRLRLQLTFRKSSASLYLQGPSFRMVTQDSPS